MNQQLLEKYLWGAATALRGTIDAGDYKQYIFPLLFLLQFYVQKKGLLPELLPIIVNNDKFFDYAIKHSAGGLSPRVKFKVWPITNSSSHPKPNKPNCLNSFGLWMR